MILTHLLLLQNLFNQQPPMGLNGSNEASSSLQADVDSLMRGNLFDAGQNSNSAIQVRLDLHITLLCHRHCIFQDN